MSRGELIAEINRDKVRNGRDELALGEREIANSETRAREKRQLLAANPAYWQKQVQRFERLQRSQSISGDQLEKSRLQLKDAQTSLSELDRSLEALQIQKERTANKRQALDLAERDLLLRAPVSGRGPGNLRRPGRIRFSRGGAGRYSGPFQPFRRRVHRGEGDRRAEARPAGRRSWSTACPGGRFRA